MRMKRIILLLAFLPCLLVFSITGTAQPENEHRAGDRMVLTIKDVEYAFRWCPPGTFMMGSLEEPGRHSNETQHQVTFSRGFWMLETPVTQAMWTSVRDVNPSYFRGDDQLPVERVHWDDCQTVVKNLNELGVAPAGFRFSLPTEAQWEYACRAGTTTAFHFGNTLNADQANFRSSGVGRTTNVGSYPANAWGLSDMHGNVWEWCLDWFGDYPENAVTDPTGGTRGRAPFRVIRGGAWDFNAGDCRSAHRFRRDPLIQSSLLGLRLSLVVETR